jgi:hypothetical protein
MNAIPQVGATPAANKKAAARSVSQALPLFASMVASASGVEVVVGGTEAMTNGKRVQIPWIDPEPGFENVMFGYTWHEIAHVKLTNFQQYRQANDPPLLTQMTNVFEDIRIERDIAKAYPGSTTRLATVSPWLVANGMIKPVQADDHPAAVLVNYTLNKLREEELGEGCLQPFHLAAEQALVKVFPSGAVIRLRGLLADVEDMTSTKDARQLAKQVLKMLEEEEQKEREQKDAGGDQAQGPQSQGQGQSGPGQTGDGDDQGDQQPHSQDAAADQSDTDGDADSEQGNGAGGDDGADALAKALAASAKDFGQTDHADLVREAINGQARQGVVMFSVPKEGHSPTDLVTGRKRINRVRSLSNLVRQRLQGLVTADREMLTQSSRGTRLNTRHLVRLKVFSTNVFKQKKTEEAPNAAVHLLIDNSSSMLDPIADAASAAAQSQPTNAPVKVPLLYEVAQDAGIALSIALEGIDGVNPAVTAFPGYGGDVAPLQKHGETISKAAARFCVSPIGTTPMAEAMWYGLLQLARQPQPKKILGVITDGEPDDVRKVTDIIRRCEAAGILVFAIGIKHDLVKDLFPVAVVIEDVSQLRGKLFEITRNLL